MSFAHAGRILHINLSTGKVWKEKLDEEIVRDYLGARGINSRLLFEKVKPGTNPLGPENVIIFGTGTLSGTNAPSSGRTTITSKSPTTNGFMKSNAGGYWGVNLKFAGYDHLVVYGEAKKPVYILIDDGQVEIRDAENLWGLSVPETDAALKKEVGIPNIETAIIGQAGENKVKMACVMLSVNFAAGRGGLGAVMGSKNLKAIAVRGTGSLKVAEPEEFHNTAFGIRKALANDPMAQGMHLFGTAGFTEGINSIGALPSYNFSKGQIDGVDKISGQYLANENMLAGRIGCASCAINCHRYSVIKTGRFAGTKTAGPEYESISALGSGFGVTEMDAVVKASALCNDYGMDTISVGGVIQWAIESVERGVLTEQDVDGMTLEWGEAEPLIELIRKIAYREGLGNLLAEGVKVASEQTGQDSYKWALQAKGLEQSNCETRSAKGYALGFAVNSRGPDHLSTQCIAEIGFTEEAKKLIERITGDESYANPYITDKRAEIVRWHEDCYAATDSLGFCSFTSTAAYEVTPSIMAKLFSAGTGIEMTEEEIMLAGRRIITLERAFNVREGYSRKDDKLPYRVMYESLPDGPNKGFINSPEEIEQLLDEYFALHEWDQKTGIPTKAVLEKLNLSELAEGIAT